MEGRFVAYYRVSTEKQGRSGLGLEAQREAVRSFLNGGKWELVAELTEEESGGDNTRPVLRQAIAAAKRAKAYLLVAKLDRLSRDTRFILELADAGVRLRFVDLPDLRIEDATGRFMLTQFAAFAELERRRIGERTSAALQAKKRRGEPLGNPENLEPFNGVRHEQAVAFAMKLKTTLDALKARGLTQRQMLHEMNTMGVKTVRGGSWSLIQLQRVLGRIGPCN